MSNPGIPTDRASVEVALRESEARYQAFLSATTDVVYRMSPDWTQLHELHGGAFVPSVDQPDRSWLETYIHPDDRPRVTEAIRQAGRQQERLHA